MKAKTILMLVVIALVGGGILWTESVHTVGSGANAAGGRKVLYYTCAMHPQVRESKPGPCPVCGMNLTPVYASDPPASPATNSSAGGVATNADAGGVTLQSISISTINVQTDVVTREPVRRTMHLSGEITGNSKQSAWFEFTAYQRDLEWLKLGQTFEISVTGVPDKTYTAQLKLHSVKAFADSDFNMMTSSTTMRAEISDGPVEVGDLGKARLFDGLHAEAHVIAETEPTLAIPRSAVISRGLGATVYVDIGGGHYAPRSVQLGRVGNDLVEVLGGLKEGEKVVTTGNILIDSEAQLTTGQ